MVSRGRRVGAGRRTVHLQHGGRAQLSSDARRYDLLVVNGWLVLRFSYEHVMRHPDFVRRVLVAAVALAELLLEAGIPGRLAA
jgi:hypothetical protein